MMSQLPGLARLRRHSRRRRATPGTTLSAYEVDALGVTVLEFLGFPLVDAWRSWCRRSWLRSRARGPVPSGGRPILVDGQPQVFGATASGRICQVSTDLAVSFILGIAAGRLSRIFDQVVRVRCTGWRRRRRPCSLCFRTARPGIHSPCRLELLEALTSNGTCRWFYPRRWPGHRRPQAVDVLLDVGTVGGSEVLLLGSPGTASNS